MHKTLNEIKNLMNLKTIMMRMILNSLKVKFPSNPEPRIMYGMDSNLKLMGPA